MSQKKHILLTLFMKAIIQEHNLLPGCAMDHLPMYVMKILRHAFLPFYIFYLARC